MWTLPRDQIRNGLWVIFAEYMKLYACFDRVLVSCTVRFDAHLCFLVLKQGFLCPRFQL